MNVRQVHLSIGLKDLEDIVRPYVESRQNKYYYLVMEHDNKEIYVLVLLPRNKESNHQKPSLKK